MTAAMERLLAEQEAWVEYVRAGVVNNEAFLRWQEVRGGDVEAAKQCLNTSRQTLRESEATLVEIRRRAERS